MRFIFMLSVNARPPHLPAPADISIRLKKKHGHRSQEGAHAGDLPNMLVAKDGSGRFEVFTDASDSPRRTPVGL